MRSWKPSEENVLRKEHQENLKICSKKNTHWVWSHRCWWWWKQGPFEWHVSMYRFQKDTITLNIGEGQKKREREFASRYCSYPVKS